MLDLLAHPSIVARELLGWTIVCRGTAAVICETEAYASDDPACHGYSGRVTARTRDLFGAAGTLYVYRSHGIHWCANLVTGREGSAEAVLLRAAMVVGGEPEVRARRAAARGVAPSAIPARELLAGPGRLTVGLDIRSDDSGERLLRSDVTDLAAALELAGDGPLVAPVTAAARYPGVTLPISEANILAGRRIGISKAQDLPWRFGIRDTLLSRPFAQ